MCMDCIVLTEGGEAAWLAIWLLYLQRGRDQMEAVVVTGIHCLGPNQ